MSVGDRIRRYRKEGGYTQLGLAEEIGLTGSAIRNYELGIRKPGKAQLEAIAKALDIAPEALEDPDISTARGALEVVFRLEEELGLKPVETDGGIALTVDPKAKGAQKAQAGLKAWKGMRDKLEAGEISQEEYESWKASFRG